MKKHFQSYYSYLKSRGLLQTPKVIAVTLLVTGLPAGYYCFYSQQSRYKETQMYKDALQHLSNYEPAVKYVGARWRVGWVKQVIVRENTVTLVVPVKGTNGSANLIVNGSKGKNNVAELESLEIDVTSPEKKKWTFYQQKKDDIATIENKLASTEVTKSKPNELSVSPSSATAQSCL